MQTDQHEHTFLTSPSPSDFCSSASRAPRLGTNVMPIIHGSAMVASLSLRVGRSIGVNVVVTAMSVLPVTVEPRYIDVQGTSSKCSIYPEFDISAL